jgi:UDP-glucose 4-epimerase
MKKVIVFGGTGYIGGHVAEELSAREYDVTIYDLVRPEWLKSNQKFVQGDLEDFEKIKEVTKYADIVYHFAGIADIEEASEKRLLAVKTNILGTTYLLEACALNKVKKFIFASTVYVYSDKGSFYRITKQACEQLVEEYSKKFGFNYVVLRYGSLYGGRAQKWNGLRRYVEEIITKGKVTLKNEGKAKRDYIHIYDAMRMSVDCLNERYNGHSLLITGTQSITQNELVSMIGEIISRKIAIEYSQEIGDHYEITPYRYHPKAGMKMTTPDFVDFGQGILEVIHEINND